MQLAAACARMMHRGALLHNYWPPSCAVMTDRRWCGARGRPDSWSVPRCGCCDLRSAAAHQSLCTVNLCWTVQYCCHDSDGSLKGPQSGRRLLLAILNPLQQPLLEQFIGPNSSVLAVDLSGVQDSLSVRRGGERRRVKGEH